MLPCFLGFHRWEWRCLRARNGAIEKTAEYVTCGRCGYVPGLPRTASVLVLPAERCLPYWQQDDTEPEER